MFKSHCFDRVTQLHIWVALVGLIWSGVLFGLYLWSIDIEKEHLAELIKLKGESLAYHTQVLRNWVGGHGGIYVEVDDKLTPHPLLSAIAERDIETPSGRKLTLLNSPAVLRQISAEFERGTGDRIRLTSHEPMNPSNLPDAWEKQALDALGSGRQEISGFVSSEGQNVFRLMYPMKTQPGCRRCHLSLTEKPMQVLGGLSILVDKTPYDQLNSKVVHQFSLGYLGIWIIGLFGITTSDIVGARLLRRIEYASTHDGLTQLKNRREIENLLGQEIKRAQRYDKPLSVMMLDIDHFKLVNDRHGHQIGDEALRVVARTIKQEVRNTDFVGRYGGEEILVIATETSIQDSKALAQRLHAAVDRAPIPLNDEETLRVTVSIGVASFSVTQNTMQTLIKSADEALYRAKESGRDRVCYSEPPPTAFDRRAAA